MKKLIYIFMTMILLFAGCEGTHDDSSKVDNEMTQKQSRTAFFNNSDNQTGMLQNINMTDPATYIHDFTIMGDALYFIGGAGLSELWKTDGNEEGTHIVKSINPSGQSRIDHLTPVGNSLFFTATDGSCPDQLWKSDGSNIGTFPVKNNNISISVSSELNGILYFLGGISYPGTPLDSDGLWKSDGTEEGTKLVKKVNFMRRSFLANLNGVLIFWVDDKILGESLFRSNGTTEGTIPLDNTIANPEVAVGLKWGLNASDYGYAVLNDSLIFMAEDPIYGVELFKTDGTSDGTILLKDINPIDNSIPKHFITMDHAVFFSADDGIHGRELWWTDGSSQNTRMVKDIHPDGNAISTGDFTSFNGKLYFSADDGVNSRHLWQSDGTEQGTVRAVEEMDPLDFSFDHHQGIGTAHANGLLFYTRENETGHHLFTLDPQTKKSRRLLTSTSGLDNLINVYNAHSLSHAYSRMSNQSKAFKNTLFFSGRDGLWKSDGTLLGTQVLHTINRTEGYNSSWPKEFTEVNGEFFFMADDGIEGYKLWKTDGRDKAAISIMPLPYESSLINVGNQLFIKTEGDLWVLDNDSNLTQLYCSGPQRARIDGFVGVNDTFFFSTTRDANNNTPTLYKSDGTISGTQVVAEIEGSSRISSLTPLKNQLIFSVRFGLHQNNDTLTSSIWRSDGTVAGTGVLVDGLEGGKFYQHSDSLLYFWNCGDFDNDDCSLWRSDGTPEGTRLLKDGFFEYGISEMASVGNMAYFFESADPASAFNHVLWKTNGTKEGTKIAFKFVDYRIGDALAAINDTLFFAASGVNADYESPDMYESILLWETAPQNHGLWKTDGTLEGTTMVKEINFSNYSLPHNFIRFKERLLFLVEDGTRYNIPELWQSDGTTIGTRKVINPHTNLPLQYIQNSVVIGDTLVFSMNDGLHGQEPWILYPEFNDMVEFE